MKFLFNGKKYFETLSFEKYSLYAEWLYRIQTECPEVEDIIYLSVMSFNGEIVVTYRLKYTHEYLEKNKEF